MYAIIEAGGRQWKVEAGTRLAINRIAGEVGATHTVDRVLFAQDGQRIQVGTPYVSGAKVLCEVLAHPLGPKTIAYHYRRRENWRKTVGSRQRLTALVVKDIQVEGMVPSVAPAKVEAPAAPAKTPVKAKTSTIKATPPKVPTAPRGAVKPAPKAKKE